MMSITAAQEAEATTMIQAASEPQVETWLRRYRRQLQTVTDAAQIEKLELMITLTDDDLRSRARARIAAADAARAARTEAPVMSTTRQDCRYCGMTMHRDGRYMVCDECGADTVGSFF